MNIKTNKAEAYFDSLGKKLHAMCLGQEITSSYKINS